MNNFAVEVFTIKSWLGGLISFIRDRYGRKVMKKLK